MYRFLIVSKNKPWLRWSDAEFAMAYVASSRDSFVNWLCSIFHLFRLICFFFSTKEQWLRVVLLYRKWLLFDDSNMTRTHHRYSIMKIRYYFETQLMSKMRLSCRWYCGSAANIGIDLSNKSDLCVGHDGSCFLKDKLLVNSGKYRYI